MKYWKMVLIGHTCHCNCNGNGHLFLIGKCTLDLKLKDLLLSLKEGLRLKLLSWNLLREWYKNNQVPKI